MSLHGQKLINAIEKNLRQPKSPNHRKDLLSLLNLVLTTRSDIMGCEISQVYQEQLGAREEPPRALVYDVYMPIWAELSNNANTESINVLKEVINGMALSVSQKVDLPDGRKQLLLSRTACSEISSLLSQRLLRILSLSSNDNANAVLEDEIVLALRSVVTYYTDGFDELVDAAKAEILRRDWARPSPHSLEALKNILTKLAFIGCSEIPVDISIDIPSQRPYSALQHFTKLVAALLQLCPLPPSSQADSRANSHVISGIHGAVLNFYDACKTKHEADVLKVSLGGDARELSQELQNLSVDWLQKAYTSADEERNSIGENDPLVYYRYLQMSLSTVRHLYQAAFQGSNGTWDDRVLSALQAWLRLSFVTWTRICRYPATWRTRPSISSLSLGVSRPK